MARAATSAAAKRKQAGKKVKQAPPPSPKVKFPRAAKIQEVSESEEVSKPTRKRRSKAPIRNSRVPPQEHDPESTDEEQEEIAQHEPPSRRRRKTTEKPRTNRANVNQRESENSNTSTEDEASGGDANAESTQGDEESEPSVFRKIKMIVSGTCQICKVTPLFNIQNDQPSLKKYGKTIDTALVRHADKIDTSGTKVFQSRCSILSCNQKEPGDEFMFVEIFEQIGRRKETRKRCFMATLFGYGSSMSEVQHIDQIKNVKNLPTLLYNGATKYWKVVQPAMEKLFSCNFLAKELSPTLMKSMAAAWILEAVRTPASHRRDKLRLTYAPALRSRAFGSAFDTVFTFGPFIPKWERYVNSPDLMREAIQVIWSDIGKELGDTINFAKAAILKISSHSFVLTSAGQFKLRLEDTDMIMNILEQITRSLEKVRA